VVKAGLEGHPHLRGESPRAAPPPLGRQGAARGGRSRAVVALSLLPCV